MSKDFKKLQNELIELKGLVRKFIDAIEHVPFRAVDCDQDKVYNLLNQMVKAVDEKTDRWL